MYRPTLLAVEEIASEMHPLWRGIDFQKSPRVAQELFRRANIVRYILIGADVQRWTSVDEMIELSEIAETIRERFSDAQNNS